jgi:hypothetical protein
MIIGNRQFLRRRVKVNARSDIDNREKLLLHYKRNLFICVSQAAGTGTFDIGGKRTGAQNTAAGTDQFDIAFNVVLAIFAGQFVNFVTSLRSDRLLEELGDIDLHDYRYDFEFGSL